MNEENLRPILITTTEEAKRLGRLGGLSRSPRKAFAARIRELKRKGLTDDSAQKIHDILADNEYSAGNILLLLEAWAAKCPPNKYPDLIRAYIEWHKLRHGTQIRVRSENLNVDLSLNLSPDDIARIVSEDIDDPLDEEGR